MWRIVKRSVARTGMAARVRGLWRGDVEREVKALGRELRTNARRETKALTAAVETLTHTVQRLEQQLADVAAQQAKAERRVGQFMATARLDERQQRDVASLPGILDVESVSAHTRSAIARAPLVQHPFPHVVVEGLVPDALYRMMLRAIPPVEFFGDADPTKQNLRIPIDRGPALATRVWEFVDDVVARRVIVPAVVEKFHAELDRHFAALFGDAFVERARALPQAPSGGRVMLRRPGYRLAPHRDPKRTMLTCLLYLAKPGESEAYGTELYDVSEDREASYTQTYYPEQAGARCTLAGMVPFRPNSMLAFMNGSGAHGAHIAGDAPAGLERYAYQFYVGPSAEDLATLLAELPDERRALWQERRVSAGANRGTATALA